MVTSTERVCTVTVPATRTRAVPFALDRDPGPPIVHHEDCSVPTTAAPAPLRIWAPHRWVRLVRRGQTVSLPFDLMSIWSRASIAGVHVASARATTQADRGRPTLVYCRCWFIFMVLYCVALQCVPE